MWDYLKSPESKWHLLIVLAACAILYGFLNKGDVLYIFNSVVDVLK